MVIPTEKVSLGAKLPLPPLGQPAALAACRGTDRQSGNRLDAGRRFRSARAAQIDWYRDPGVCADPPVEQTAPASTAAAFGQCCRHAVLFRREDCSLRALSSDVGHSAAG